MAARGERNVIACFACRESKRKCDLKQPCCTLCAKKSIDCIYPTTSNRKPANKIYVNSLKNRIAALEEALRFCNGRKLGFEMEQLCQHSFYPNLSKRNFQRSLGNVSSGLKDTVPHERPKNLKMESNWRLNIIHGRILFEGPSSSRYISTSGSAYKENVRSEFTLNELDTFHNNVFKWFFNTVNKTLPLINEDLFISSLEGSTDDESTGSFVSCCLINSIVAIFYMKHGEDYSEFKKLAIQQVNEEIHLFPKVTTVQCLILLFTIEMTNGNEFLASDFISRAVSTSYHLGLHVNSDSLIGEGKLNTEEARVRDVVFWCCFLVDRLKLPIVGMHPFLNCTDISIRLPHAQMLNGSGESMEVFREIVCFSDFQLKLLEDRYGFHNFTNLDDPAMLLKQRLLMSEDLQILSEWKKNLPSAARLKNNRSSGCILLEVSQLTVQILIYKPLLVHPMKSDTPQEDLETSPINICTSCSETIVKLFETYDMRQDLFIYQYLYSLYLSSIICLFNCTSSNVRVKKRAEQVMKSAFKLFEETFSLAPVADVYYSNLKSFQKEWKSFFVNNIVEDQTVVASQDKIITQEDLSMESAPDKNTEGNDVDIEDNMCSTPSWLEFSHFINTMNFDQTK